MELHEFEIECEREDDGGGLRKWPQCGFLRMGLGERRHGKRKVLAFESWLNVSR